MKPAAEANRPRLILRPLEIAEGSQTSPYRGEEMALFRSNGQLYRIVGTYARTKADSYSSAGSTVARSSARLPATSQS